MSFFLKYVGRYKNIEFRSVFLENVNTYFVFKHFVHGFANKIIIVYFEVKIFSKSVFSEIKQVLIIY